MNSHAVSNPSIRPAQWRSLVLLTVGALALYLGFRNLPTGTNLSHMDFRPDGNSVEMCDPSNPQFMPVVSVRSPVVMTLAQATTQAGQPFETTLHLETASGRPVGPEDLAVVHTEKLHLLVVDPTLQDYQHLHPVPGKVPGDWVVRFTPKRSGTYRFFGDFTPLATGRGLYGFVDLQVEASGSEKLDTKGGVPWQFALELSTSPMRAGVQGNLTLRVAGPEGKAVPLGLVMGAYAHLVAFDQARQGYAHLHPLESDPAWRPDPKEPRLTFAVTIPSPGDYMVWAQVVIDGQEYFHPFPLRVEP